MKARKRALKRNSDERLVKLTDFFCKRECDCMKRILTEVHFQKHFDAVGNDVDDDRDDDDY